MSQSLEKQQEGPGAEGTPTPGAAATPPPAATEQPGTAAGPDVPKWATRRIDGLTADLYKERAEKAALETRLAALQTQNAEGAGEAATKEAPKGLSEDQLRERIEKEANRRAEQIAFDRECNRSFAKGKEKYSDFADKITDLQKSVGVPVSTVQSVMEMDDPHEIFYALAQDKEWAEEINSMSPTKRAVALAKFAMESAKKPTKARSAAPPPIGDGAVRGSADGGELSVEDGRMSMAEFVKKREQDMKARRAARRH